MSNFHLIPLAAGILNLALTLFVGAVNPRRRVNQVFVIVGSSIAIWNLGAFALHHTEDSETALFRARWLMVGVILLPAAFFHLTCEFARDIKMGRWVRFAYLMAALLLATNVAGYFVVDVRYLDYAWFSLAGPGFWAYSLAYFPASAYGIFRVLKELLPNPSRLTARAAKILLATLGAIYLGGAHDLLPVLGWAQYPGTDIPILPWGTLMASFYGVVIAYGVLSDQLLDVRVSLSREIATGLRIVFLIAIVLVLLAPLGVIRPDAFSGTVIATTVGIVVFGALITSAFFPRLLGGLSTRWSQRVLGDRFEYRDRLNELINEMPFIESRRDLACRTVEVISASLKLNSCGIYLQSNQHTPDELSWLHRSSARPPTELWQDTSPLWERLRATSVLNAIPTQRESGDPVQQLLAIHQIEIVQAIGLRPSAPIGMLIIGARGDRQHFTQLDFELFGRVAQSLAHFAERFELHRTADLRLANRAKDQFLASVNHEIRNPLNGIVGIARMLEETGVEPRQRFLLSSLRGCADHLQSILDDVLDFRQVEEQVITLRPSTAELSTLLKSACTALDPTGQHLTCASPEAAEIWVRMDTGKYRQMIANLLSNALKYGIPPGGRVDFIAASGDNSRCRIRTTVTSTGPTLDTEELAQLFSPLSRGRRARETGAHGMGLGLALVRRIAEAMGGSVGARSENGQSEFWFEVEAETTSAPTATPVGAVSEEFRGARVLAVEDEPYNRLVLNHLLDQLGITTTWAETASAALRLAMEQRFDYVIMDWFLPDLTGVELLAGIQRESVQPAPPVIVATAYSTTAKRTECLQAGAKAFISKPVDLPKVVEALRGAATTKPAFAPPDPGAPVRSAPSTIDDRNLNESIARVHQRLLACWRDGPTEAALMAHRLRSLLRLAGDEAGAELLGIVETALHERWATPSIETLIQQTLRLRSNDVPGESTRPAPV